MPSLHCNLVKWQSRVIISHIRNNLTEKIPTEKHPQTPVWFGRKNGFQTEKMKLYIAYNIHFGIILGTIFSYMRIISALWHGKYIGLPGTLAVAIWVTVHHCGVKLLSMHKKEYRKVSNIRRILVGNKIVDHSDVVGASPVSAAPTTSSFST